MAWARPRGQHQQQQRVPHRGDGVALGGRPVQQRAGAGAARAVAAGVGDLDLAVVDVQPGVLVDLVLLQPLARRQRDRDQARRAVV